MHKKIIKITITYNLIDIIKHIKQNRTRKNKINPNVVVIGEKKL